MALMLDIVLSDVDIASYHRIGAIAVAVGSDLVSVTLESYRSRDHRAQPVRPLRKRMYQFTRSGSESLMVQGYAHIKSLPEFDLATDC